MLPILSPIAWAMATTTSTKAFCALLMAFWASVANALGFVRSTVVEAVDVAVLVAVNDFIRLLIVFWATVILLSAMVSRLFALVMSLPLAVAFVILEFIRSLICFRLFKAFCNCFSIFFFLAWNASDSISLPLFLYAFSFLLFCLFSFLVEVLEVPAMFVVVEPLYIRGPFFVVDWVVLPYNLSSLLSLAS